MSEDLKNSILIKMYKQYFENYVIGIHRNALENEFTDARSNDVRMVLNELEEKFLIALDSGSYKITTFGIKYLEEEELVDNSKPRQRNDIVKILKESYEEDVDKNVSHSIIIEKLNLSGPIEILSQMKILEENGYVHLDMALGGNFWTRLNHSGYELAQSLT